MPDEKAKRLIDPRHQSVARLLGAQQTFQAPRYQRNYAWGKHEISTFLRDMENCLQRRLAGGEGKHHFFGGLVTVDAPIPASSRSNLEVVDGQQRLATFAMLISQMRHALVSLASSLEAGDKLKPVLEHRAAMLASSYEVLQDEIQLENVEVARVQLSAPDQPFFAALLAGGNPAQERKSHRLLAEAYQQIGDYVRGQIDSAPDVPAKAERLHHLHEVLKTDWTIIHMAATDKDDAYMLFQVLNDRGVSLTEGELLRSATLEAMEQAAGLGQISEVEELWDEVLAEEPHIVRNAIGWLYASQMGQWPSRGTSLDDYMLAFFPAVSRGTRLDARGVSELVDQMRRLATEFRGIKSLTAGEWPISAAGSNSWQRNRLRLLTFHLRYTDCISLLIAATNLPCTLFARLVILLERFAFRYHVIGDGPRDRAQGVLNRFAVDIRRDADAFDITTLRAELHTLVERHVPDATFKGAVEQLRYTRGQFGNKALKYLLMTLEDYHRWFDDNPQGDPVCRDETRILDFESSTIEHVYAQHADDQDPTLDAMVDTLGNLTFLSGPENDRLGSRAFAHKRQLLRESGSTMNRLIGEREAWTVRAIEDRAAQLVAMTMRIFQI